MANQGSSPTHGTRGHEIHGDPGKRSSADSARRIDPEVEAAARHADMPNADFYDTSMIDRTGPGNFWTLGMVLAFCIFLLALLVVAVIFLRRT